MIRQSSVISPLAAKSSDISFSNTAEPSLVMVAPSNGLYYDSFVLDQYFNTEIEGAVAADRTTMDAIDAILAMPNPVQLADEALVIAAREAYNKIATTELRALVDAYYPLLQSAEIRIQAFKNTGNTEPPVDDTPVVDVPQDNANGGFVALLVSTIVLGAIVLGGATFVVIYFFVLKKGLTVCGVRFGNETVSVSAPETAETDDETDA